MSAAPEHEMDPKMDRNIDRRAFLGLGLDRARHGPGENRRGLWFRPPHALDEHEFLATCTRCDKCLEACPEEVIFRLPERYGEAVHGTPVLDLLNKGCRLCQDWPCVTACEPGALKRPQIRHDTGADPAADGAIPLIPLPRLATARIDTNRCLPYLGPECGACAESCPVPGALAWNGPKPVIRADLCVGCGLCREICITEPKSILITAVQTGT